NFDAYNYVTNGRIVFTGAPLPPEPSEAGWKDTVRAAPRMITRIIVRFEGYTGRYMWHCHILEHGDNEMMRPFDVRGPSDALKSSNGGASRRRLKRPCRAAVAWNDPAVRGRSGEIGLRCDETLEGPAVERGERLRAYFDMCQALPAHRVRHVTRQRAHHG